MIGGNGVTYFHERALPRLINSSIKMFQDLGHQTMSELLNECPQMTNNFYSRLLQNLCPLINSHSAIVRLKIIEYFEKIFRSHLNGSHTNGHIKNCLEKFLSQPHNYQLIEYFLFKISKDYESAIQQRAIDCTKLYYEASPDRCKDLVSHVFTDDNVKKKLIDYYKSKDPSEYDSTLLNDRPASKSKFNPEMEQVKKLNMLFQSAKNGDEFS